MIQENFRDVVFEFSKGVSAIGAVKAIMLFGSVGRGKADNRSDVDFLVMFNTAGNPNKMNARTAVSKIALDIEKTFNKNIQVVFTNRNFDKLDRQFVETVLREGITVYGKGMCMAFKKAMLEPHSLINFSLEGLTQKDKMRFKAALYGYSTVRKYKKKIYKSASEGILKGVLGRRVGKGSVMVPSDQESEVLDVLKRFSIKCQKIDVWIPKV